MRKKFVNELMKRKVNHLIITNQCSNLSQVYEYTKKEKKKNYFCYVFIDHGTSHVSIIDAEGNAVAATSTINTA
jgi:gamma-glutamyltranspeptidase